MSFFSYICFFLSLKIYYYLSKKNKEANFFEGFAFLVSKNYFLYKNQNFEYAKNNNRLLNCCKKKKHTSSESRQDFPLKKKNPSTSNKI